MIYTKKSFLLGLFNAVGNFVFLVGLRWVDFHDQSYFKMVWYEKTIITWWSLGSSVLLFVAISLTLNYLEGKSATRVAITTSVINVLVLLLHLPLNFKALEVYRSIEEITVYPFMSFMGPYGILTFQSALITGILYFNSKKLKDKEKLYEEIRGIYGHLIFTTAFLFVTGMILTFVQVQQAHTITSGPWLLLFSSWIMYIGFGAFICLLSIHLKLRELVSE